MSSPSPSPSPSSTLSAPVLHEKVKQTYDLFLGNVGVRTREISRIQQSKLAIKLLDEYTEHIHVPSTISEGYYIPPSISTLQTQLRKHQSSDPIQSASKNTKQSIHTDLNTAVSTSIAAFTPPLLDQLNSSFILNGPSALDTSHIAPNTTLPISKVLDQWMQDSHISSTVQTTSTVEPLQETKEGTSSRSLALVKDNQELKNIVPSLKRQRPSSASSTELQSLVLKRNLQGFRPTWHAPWKLHRVISGHQGWVQTIAVDPSNEWFASGGNDRLIKIWDLATGSLKLSLTGHINTIRDIAISARHPYLFSCGEDNRVTCWDLEQNKIIRSYHGHLSGVYCLTLHPGLDILASGGRDAVVRVWDMRTKNAIYVLSGHRGTVTSLQSQSYEPQLISGSQDKTVRLWDIKTGKCHSVLTNHKKSVRAMALHPSEYTFCTAAADNVKVWKCPSGNFERNIEGHTSILNCCAIKEEGDSSMLVAGSHSGHLHFWDWKSGHLFNTITSRVQPGSLESENGIFACAFDRSETRLITGECDKTIKVWKEDEEATPETHPINWKPTRDFSRHH